MFFEIEFNTLIAAGVYVIVDDILPMRIKSIVRILLIDLPLIRNRIYVRQRLHKGKLHRPGTLRDAQHLALGLLSDDRHINK